MSGVTIPGPTKTVVVNSSGQLGTAPAGTAPADPRSQARTALASSRTLAKRLGTTRARVQREEGQITELRAQNRRLASEIAQLRSLVLHHR